MSHVPPVRTVHEQVLENLRQLILEGDFAPGDKLQQDDLATQLGVSAMPVREGLRHLHAEGLVQFIPRRGAFVATLTPLEFDELYHMREELEALALRWAIERITSEQIQILRQRLEHVDNAEAHRDSHRRSRAIRAFLWSLFGISGRPHVYQAIQRYYNMTYLYQRQYSAVADLAGRRAEIYHRMLDAIAGGDVERAIAAHRENYRLIRATMLPLLEAAAIEPTPSNRGNESLKARRQPAPHHQCSK